MYTVHKSVQSDMYSVFTELSDMGYEGIEFYGEPVFDLDVLKRSITDSKLVARKRNAGIFGSDILII